jgi:uncharacterized lipoprotein YmbA
MSKLSILAMAMAAGLAACASMQPEDQSASLQNAVYVVGDNAAAAQMTVLPDGQEEDVDSSDESTLMRLYWFLGGR